MGGRYLVTGTQLGMLQALIALGKNEDAEAQVKGITENQYICDSEQDLEIDIKTLRDYWDH